MKATELRPGNLINKTSYVRGCPNTIVTLNGVNNQGFLNVTHLGEKVRLRAQSIHYFEPIILTDEWLLKFGFVYVGEFDEYRYRDETNWFGICDDCDSNGTKFYFFERQNMSTVVIESVHQLQNLYFALAREELTIKGL